MKRVVIYLLICIFAANAAFAQQAPLQTDLSLKYIVRQAHKKTANPPVVIMMHGYGSNEGDLFELSRYIPDSFIVISARAPYPQDRGYRWFDLDKSQQKFEAVKAELESSRKLVLKFVQEVGNKYHTKGNRIYIMGFSQGAIMSYAAGLTSPTSVKGIGILSGLLPQAIRAQTNKSPALSKVRVFIAHGTADAILSYADGKAANDYLLSLGLKPEFHTYNGMQHTISGEVLSDLISWLIK